MAAPVPCGFPSKSFSSSHPVRHVIFTFNLRGDGASFDNEINRRLIENLFPDVLKVRFNGLFLTFCVRKMPCNFLPETVAGVPVYFTEDENDIGPNPAGEPLGLRTGILHSKGSAVPSINGGILQAAADHIIEHDIPVLEFHLWQDFILVILEDDDVDRHLLPQVIAHCNVSYMYRRDISIIQAAIRGAANDWRTDTDCSAYDNLQPGVMLSSGTDPVIEGNEINPESIQPEIFSSSGVMVTDVDSNRFMTVSLSGFLFDTKVIHPALDSLNSRCLGEIVRKIPHADIGLVKLETNEVLNNQPFQNTIIEQLNIGSLREFVDGFRVDMGTPVYINAPSTGYKRGVLGPWAKIKIDRTTSSEKIKWVNARMIYFSCTQTKEAILPEGMAGTPVWDKLGRVLGVVRGNKSADMVLRNWIYMIPSEYLTELGYTMTIEGATNPAEVCRDNSPEAMIY